MSETQRPTLTTILTTYRRPTFLKRAIRSILNQTFTDFQLCVYDNASGDETAAIVQELSAQDPRVKYHCHTENIGMMANYQYAFERIDTPYFHFLSDDDYVLPHFFAAAMQEFRQCEEAAFVACGIVQLDLQGHVTGSPLMLWERDGVYSSRLGVLEMLKTRFRFPVPTGVIIRTTASKTIQPRFTEEAQLYWDPDYLLRLTMEWPIVIHKAICGVYTAHQEGFAVSIYAHLTTHPEPNIKYLKATQTVHNSIRANTSLSRKDRQKAVALFKTYVSQDVFTFMKVCLGAGQYANVHLLAKLFYQHFGGMASIFSLWLLVYCAQICKMLGLSRLFRFCIPDRFFIPVSPPPAFYAIDVAETTQWHVYGASLK